MHALFQKQQQKILKGNIFSWWWMVWNMLLLTRLMWLLTYSCVIWVTLNLEQNFKRWMPLKLATFWHHLLKILNEFFKDESLLTVIMPASLFIVYASHVHRLAYFHLTCPFFSLGCFSVLPHISFACWDCMICLLWFLLVEFNSHLC